MNCLKVLALAGAAGLAAAMPAQAQDAGEPREEVCALQVRGSDDPFIIDGGVIALTQREDRVNFRVSGRDRARPESVHCIRSSVVPAENDYKIVLAGLPLTISTPAEDGARTSVALELVEDRFRLKVIQGELTEQELALAAERIEGYSQALATGGS